MMGMCGIRGCMGGIENRRRRVRNRGNWKMMRVRIK
jgi:hypothetical protein